MKNELASLIELQETEKQIAALESSLKNTPEKIEALESELKKSEEELEALKNQKQESSKIQRSYERETEDMLIRVKKSEERLKSIKSNKEYQAGLKEIEDTKKRIKLAEEEIIKCFEKQEQISAQFEESQKKLLVQQGYAAAKKKDLEKRLNVCRTQLKVLSVKKNEALAKIPPKLLKNYEVIKKHSRGIGVAQAQNEVCCGCNMNIPPQMYNDLQKTDDICFCPHCQRIIYWKEPEAGAEDSE